MSRDEADTCFHCGEPNPSAATFQQLFDGQMRRFCCAGCEAVASTILAAGMGDFYRKRQRPSLRPDDLVPAVLASLEQYDAPALADASIGGSTTTDLLIDGMTCAACAWLAERSLRRVPGVKSVSVQYATGRAEVIWRQGATPLSTLLGSLRKVGLDARPADSARDADGERRRARRELLEWLVAGLAMMQVMMYSIPVYLAPPGDISPEFDQLMRWASLVLTLPVILYSSRRFFANAWRDLRHGQVGMDVPVALALALTFTASAIATVQGQGHIYFDSITMFVFLLLSARYLEHRARRRAARAMERLAPALPPLVEKLTGWPEQEAAKRIPGTQLLAGDIVRIPAGGIIPADATVLAGNGSVDESLLTGESRPIPRGVGDVLLGGSLNLGSPLVARVDRTGDASTLAQLAQLARRALATKPPASRLASNLAAWFSVSVLGLASLTLLLWWPTSPDAAFRHAVAVLVVTCPCALALALPAAWAAASGRLSQWGLLTVTPHALDALQGITDVVLDKTGTLTESRLTLNAAVALGTTAAARCTALAAAMETGSVHPLADALRRHQLQQDGHTAQSERALTPDASATHLSGQGIEAIIEGQRLRLGSRHFVEALSGPLPADQRQALIGMGASPTDSVVWLGAAQGWLAAMSFGMTLRPDAVRMVQALDHTGIAIHLLSGDDEAVVQSVAAMANIRNARGNALPDDKRAFVAALQSSGRRVLMVGDGCNDAPVLAQADAAIAMSLDRDGADMARAQADLLLVSGELMRIPQALSLAAAARAVMRQNLGWALAYNLCSVPLAMAGLIHPWIAALGMSASSLLVVANAARLLEFTPLVREHHATTATTHLATDSPA